MAAGSPPTAAGCAVMATWTDATRTSTETCASGPDAAAAAGVAATTCAGLGTATAPRRARGARARPSNEPERRPPSSTGAGVLAEMAFAGFSLPLPRMASSRTEVPLRERLLSRPTPSRLLASVADSGSDGAGTPWPATSPAVVTAHTPSASLPAKARAASTASVSRALSASSSWWTTAALQSPKRRTWSTASCPVTAPMLPCTMIR